MVEVYDRIQQLGNIPSNSKHESLVNGIIDSIDEKILTHGDVLPSVNKMVHELGYARKTITKAYDELKNRGIIQSKNRLGYFVATEDTEQKLKVAILLYAFQTFQEVFFNTFRKSLGPNVHLDVFFHHQNPEVYASILREIHSKYGMYVIAPIQEEKLIDPLKELPASKVLLIDRFIPAGGSYSYIAQEFEQSFYQALRELHPKLNHYKELCLIYKEKSDYPQGTKEAFLKYCGEYGLNAKVIPQYSQGNLCIGTAYFTIGDTDLWELLRDCKKNKLRVGKDIGILSQNDSPVKELVAGGISTFSTDFPCMARKAAHFVLEGKPIKQFIPSKLILRNSL